MNELGDEQVITETLHKYAARGVPSSINLYPAILVRQDVLASSKRRTHNQRTLSGLVGLAALLTAYFLAPLLWANVTERQTSSLPQTAVTVSAEATTQTMQQALPWQAAPLRLGQSLNLTEQREGYTVTLSLSYADTHVLALGLQITTTAAKLAIPSQLELRDSQGHLLPLLAQSKVQHEQQSETDSVVASFDSSNLSVGTPGAVALSLYLLPTNRLSYTNDKAYSGVTRSSPSLALQQPQVGPFNFNFVPKLNLAEELVSGGQEVTVNGVTVVLDHLIVSPSQLRAYLRYTLASGKVPQSRPYLALEGADWATQSSSRYSGHNTAIVAAEEVSQQADGSWLYTVTGNLYDKGGDCRLIIYHLHDSVAGDLPGPWVFPVSLPVHR